MLQHKHWDSGFGCAMDLRVSRNISAAIATRHGRTGSERDPRKETIERDECDCGSHKVEKITEHLKKQRR